MVLNEGRGFGSGRVEGRKRWRSFVVVKGFEETARKVVDVAWEDGGVKVEKPLLGLGLWLLDD